MFNQKTKKTTGTVLSVVALFVIAASAIVISNVKKTIVTSKAANENKTYNYSFGPKGTVPAEWDTAEELLKRLIVNGFTPMDVLRYNGTEFEIYKYYGVYDGEEYFIGTDFPIKAGEGYYLQFKENVGKDITDIFSDYQPLYSQDYNLNVGWQLVSIPEGVINNLTSFKAQDLCDKIQSQGGHATNIALSKFLPAQDKNIISVEYLCESGEQNQNFLIKPDMAFFIKVDKNSQLNLP